jgi:hypothetical protein
MVRVELLVGKYKESIQHLAQGTCKEETTSEIKTGGRLILKRILRE